MSSTGPDERLRITVVVCTFNRATHLAHALESIARAAAVAPCAVDLVIVDNNSTDTTRTIAQDWGARASLPVRYIFEKVQGLSYARNAGVRSARGSVVAFTDDDCIVDPEWLTALAREFAVAEVAIVGGRVDLFNPDDRPVSIRPIAERIRYTDAGQVYGYIMGCNLAVRRVVFDTIGGFDPAFGGANGVVADDIDFVYRAFRHGFGVLYTPSARVLHDHGRRTDGSLRGLSRAYVRGRGAFFCKHILQGDLTICRHAWWEIRSQLAPGDGSPRTLARVETLRMLASGALRFITGRLRLVPF